MTGNLAPLRVLVDASPLVDGRGEAGIGRYVSSLLASIDGVDGVTAIAARPSGPPAGESWERRFLHGQPALLSAAVRHRPALVHCCANEPALLWPLSRQVVTVHDVIPWTSIHATTPRRRRIYLAYQRRRLQRAAALIAVSDLVRDEAVSVLGASARRIHVVREGVSPIFGASSADDDVFLRHQAGVDRTGYLLWVGSLRFHDPRKGLDVLVAALTELTTSPAPNLVFVGAPGFETERLRELLDSAGVATSFPGHVPDPLLAALYRGAGAVVIPSMHEGFGLPMLEAMTSGAPVVAARAGNLPDLAGGAAELVPPGDATALARAIDRVLAEPGTSDRLRAAGLQRAKGMTWDGTAQKTVEVYRTVARGLTA